MRTVASEPQPGFAVWFTGLPASGKSTIAARAVDRLRAQGIECVVLESDALRREFPELGYDSAGRDLFYRTMVFLGRAFTARGIPVVFDATANRRSYRDAARTAIPRFLEIYISTPLEICLQRDPKGIYRNAQRNESSNVPGLQAGYEAPLAPELTIDGSAEPADTAALQVVELLE